MPHVRDKKSDKQTCVAEDPRAEHCAHVEAHVTAAKCSTAADFD